jgi:hypothetical protein
LPRTLGHRIRSSVELCLELNGAREDVNSEEMLEARFCSYGDSVHCADTALRLAMAVSPPIENYLSSKKFDVGAELWTRSSSGFPGIRKPFNAFSCLSSDRSFAKATVARYGFWSQFLPAQGVLQVPAQFQFVSRSPRQSECSLGEASRFVRTTT